MRLYQLAFIVAAIAVATCTTFIFNQSIETKRSSQPVPTSEATLATLKNLGAKWELNKYGQVVKLYMICLPISDQDLTILKKLPEIRTLKLHGIHYQKGHHFTNEGLLHFLSLKNLEHLILSKNPQLTDECSKTIGKLKTLKRLDISDTKITEKSLANLCLLKNLKILHFNKRDQEITSLDESTINYFQQMPLRKLDGIKITESSFSLLPRLTRLETLPIHWYEPVKDTHLKHLRHMKKIDRLTVKLSNGWSDASQLKHLQALPELTRLTIQADYHPDQRIDISGLNSLAKISSLKRIDPGVIDDQILEVLSHCDQITQLKLTVFNRHVTTRGLKFLINMKNLREITLGHSLVCDETFQILGQIRSLRKISLERQNLTMIKKITDESKGELPLFSMSSLKHLANLPLLKELDIDFLPINDETLLYIGSFRSLELLSMQDTLISNAGLLHLRHLSNLKYLSFCGNNISNDAAYQLHQFIPQCKIEDSWCCGCLAIEPIFVDQ